MVLTNSPGQSYELSAFPAAAVRFARALDRNKERIAEEEGLSASELRTVFYVGEHVSVTPKQLADHMHVTTAAITLISRRLVEIEMLHRVDHPEDRRSLLLQLTPHGHQTVARIHSEFDSMIGDATGHLDPSQITAFTETLESVGTAILQHTARMNMAKVTAGI